ncbi:barstar family protein [Chryseobacterium sp. WG14]|uniref:barstar family protein n=1 Tax=Chryseobacterium sp. WG14 TaxID=2926909 RepID=UPI00211F2EC9|nr:barstar family protein [Chryseobacterium sp. WG14]MCQ9639365.1 barstar family protein [Chryseobacterium sp. WG14]
MKIIFNGKNNVIHYIKIKRQSNKTIDHIYIYHSDNFLVEDFLVGINIIEIINNTIIEISYLNMILTKASILTKSKTYTKLEGFIREEDGYLYDQDIIDTLYDWDNGKIIDWRSKSERFKASYINACSLGNYRQFKFINSENKMLDGNKVNSKNELYIMLGELFYGIGGFFGSGLDGLYDYLIDVSKNNSLNEMTLLIINKENLILKLDEDYYRAFVKILKNKKFNVIEK